MKNKRLPTKYNKELKIIEYDEDEIIKSKGFLMELYLAQKEYMKEKTKEINDCVKAMQSYLDLNKINNETTRK